MCNGRVCFNLLITPVYLEIVFAIDSVCEVHFICLLSMIPRNLKSLTIYISSSIKVIFGYRTCFCGIWNTVILVDSVCELFGETIRNVCGCSCYFVVECYGCV